MTTIVVLLLLGLLLVATILLLLRLLVAAVLLLLLGLLLLVAAVLLLLGLAVLLLLGLLVATILLLLGLLVAAVLLLLGLLVLLLLLLLATEAAETATEAATETATEAAHHRADTSAHTAATKATAHHAADAADGSRSEKTLETDTWLEFTTELTSRELILKGCSKVRSVELGGCWLFRLLLWDFRAFELAWSLKLTELFNLTADFSFTADFKVSVDLSLTFELSFADCLDVDSNLSFEHVLDLFITDFELTAEFQLILKVKSSVGLLGHLVLVSEGIAHVNVVDLDLVLVLSTEWVASTITTIWLLLGSTVLGRSAKWISAAIGRLSVLALV